MKPWVDVEGSGALTTVITGGLFNFLTLSGGTLRGADNAEVRFLTVKGTDGAAIVNSNASPRITNVSATVSGGTYSDYGVLNYSSSATMTDVTATASGGFHSVGVENDSAVPTIRNSRIEGSTYSMTGTDSPRVGASQPVGSVSGSLTCVDAYDGSFAPLSNTCQPMP